MSLIEATFHVAIMFALGVGLVAVSYIALAATSTLKQVRREKKMIHITWPNNNDDNDDGNIVYGPSQILSEKAQQLSQSYIHQQTMRMARLRGMLVELEHINEQIDSERNQFFESLGSLHPDTAGEALVQIHPDGKLYRVGHKTKEMVQQPDWAKKLMDQWSSGDS